METSATPESPRPSLPTHQPQHRLPLKHPPGPSGFWQKLRNIFAYNHNPFFFFEELRAKYGDFVLNRAMGFDFYIMYNPELIEHVLVRNAKNYIKDPFLTNWKDIFGDGLLTAEGEAWKRERRMTQPAFHRDRMPAYAGMMVQSTLETTKRWRSTGTKTVAINREMMALTLDVVVRTLFGVQMTPGTEKRVAQAFDICGRYFEFTKEPLGYHLSKYPSLPRYRYRKAVTELDAILGDILTERRKLPLDRGDLLGILLATRDEDGSAMSDKQLRDELMTLFLAGHETTALALTYSIYLLCTHPESQRKVAEEIKHAFKGKPVNWSGLEQLTYTKQVVQEALRLYPPAWVLAREASEDDQVHGYPIRKGAHAVVPTWAIHRDARFYEQPSYFKPERWTSEFQKTLPRAAYIPFGFGPRMCIGSMFAMIEAQLVLATIVQNFELTLADPTQKLSLQGSITARPRHNVMVQLRDKMTDNA